MKERIILLLAVLISPGGLLTGRLHAADRRDNEGIILTGKPMMVGLSVI
jgi:hypothetical protein